MFISVVVARGILSELANRGIDPDEVLRLSRLPRARIMDLREYLSFRELERLVQHAVASAKDPALGLAAGAHAPKTMLQALGHLMLAHDTLRDAFASWQRYCVLLTDGLRFRMLEQDELALFICEPVREHEQASFFVDLALASAARMGTHFSSGRSQLHEVHLRHPAPSYAQRYRSMFPCPVRFQQEHNALIVPRELLDRPQLNADQTMCSVLRETADRLLHDRAQKQTLAARVRNLLECPPDFASLDTAKIARRLGLSVRSLRRRLASEGTSLYALVDEARCHLACQALLRPGARVKEISELLQFSDTSAFHRAFKRWTGHTPKEYVRIAAEKHARAASHGRRAGAKA